MCKSETKRAVSVQLLKKKGTLTELHKLDLWKMADIGSSQAQPVG